MTEDFTFQHEQHDYCPQTGERCGCYRGYESCCAKLREILKAQRATFDKIFEVAP